MPWIRRQAKTLRFMFLLNKDFQNIFIMYMYFYIKNVKNSK